MNSPFPNLTGKHRTEPVPPETYSLVAEIDTSFEKDILDLPIPDVHHHREADHLG
jgi:hypothetical protein